MFKGTITALITPFKSEPKDNPAVDFQTLEKLVEWQIASGISGFVVCGTTGESATLDAKEKLSLIKRVVEVANKRIPVIAGTGSNCTRTSIEMTRAAKEVGADGTLIVAPYYNKPSQEGLFQHFSAIAKSGGLPVVVYNVPGRTSVDISVETYSRLAEVDGIVAIKEASGSADRLMDLSRTVGDKLSVLSGDDSLTYLTMTVGGKGVISASSNVIPKEMTAITSNAAQGDLAKALQVQLEVLPLIRALFMETNPTPVKAALMLLGKIPSETFRLPLVPVKHETRELLDSLIKANNYKI